MIESRTPFVIGSALLLASCVADPVYTAPYSLFTTEQVISMTDNRRAFAFEVDGSALAKGDSMAVKPGLRTVQLRIGEGSNYASRQLTVDAQPCMRYIVVASRSSATDDDWTPGLNRSEPIGECNSKFMK